MRSLGATTASSSHPSGNSKESLKQKRGQKHLFRGPARRAAFTLVELLVVIAIIGLLIALLLPAIQAAREAGRRAQCSSQMHQVAIALLNYEAIAKSFPPGALCYATEANPNATLKYMANWIILILPQMDHRDVYQSFAFNSPDPVVKAACIAGQVGSGFFVSDGDLTDGNPGAYGNHLNAAARAHDIPSLLCASDNAQNRTHFQGAIAGEARDWARGNVACNNGNYYYGAGNCGNGSCAGSDEKSLWTNPMRRGIMGYNNHEINLGGITDGTTQTILVAEIRVGLSPADRRGTWAMGGGNGSMMVGAGGMGDDDGPNACYANGDDVWGCAAFYNSAGGGQFATCNE